MVYPILSNSSKLTFGYPKLKADGTQTHQGFLRERSPIIHSRICGTVMEISTKYNRWVENPLGSMADPLGRWSRWRVVLDTG